ncbi:MAG: nucleotidyltransferase domain-containing protein [Deltaproteobacteria bacterium]|nr:nucleotidyltransferase domain-containing protein [Deltaproteobacteria bacterium]
MIPEERLQVIDRIPYTQYIVERLKQALKPYKKEVRFAFLFGSYAKGEADNWSDVDIGIYFGKDVGDEKRNEIRFAVMDALEPLEAQIGYLDDEYMSPEIFIAAADGITIVMNDEEIYHDELLKNIHIVEEMKLIGLA